MKKNRCDRAEPGIFLVQKDNSFKLFHVFSFCQFYLAQLSLVNHRFCDDAFPQDHRFRSGQIYNGRRNPDRTAPSVKDQIDLSVKIFCDSADKLIITVKKGSENTLCDGKNYSVADGPNAPLYSDDDLSIGGEGVLNIKAKYKNGISSKNDIKIKEVTLNVESYNTGIRGKTSVTISSGVITIDAGNDGIKSTEEVKEAKGFVEISGGTVKITAGDDGVQAAKSIILSGGVVSINSEGKKTNAPTVDVTEGVLQ